LQGSRWDPKNKVWTATNNLRNRFAISYMARAPKGREGHDGFTPNPYRPYDADLVPFTPTRPLMQHQIRMVRHGLTVKRGVWAADMGTGKTLASIELMEALGWYHTDYWYVAPKSALVAVKSELKKWGCRIIPELMTYDGLVKRINE